MSNNFIAILMGSDSDLETMQATIEVLQKFAVKFEVNILSAHRTPDLTHRYVQDAEQRGCVAFIAAAGMAAHLAGTVAALTIKPVIGVPIAAGPLSGLDALLATVQMPGGVPVACMAIHKAGAKNAAYFALQILALQDNAIAEKLKQERTAMRAQLIEKNQSLQNKFN